MPTTERSVLHVLPHPGGGGETYVDLLEGIRGYRFERRYLAETPAAGPALAARGAIGMLRRARGFDLVHAHGEVAGALCIPVLASRPSVVTLHGLHLVRRLSGTTRTVAALALRAVLRAADRTICVSESEHAELIGAVGRSAARRGVVIQNGVHVPPTPSVEERLAVRKSLGISPSETLAIWVGSLDERKDPLTAVRAAAEANITLLVVGDGPLRPQVEQAARVHVRVLGQRSDIPQLLDAADVYVLTSHREGLALSLLEAIAHALPCVVTDLPENVEAVGDAGIVAPLGDHRALVAALRRMAIDEGERATLGARALERAQTSFALETMLDRTRAIYEAVLAH